MSKKMCKNFPGGDIITPIRFLVLDVDGVMTDGAIIYASDGSEQKNFNVKDGAGIKYWQRAGHGAGIISGRSSPAVSRRAEELGIELVEMNALDKLPAFTRMLSAAGVQPHEVAVIGDDLPDLPLIARAGLGMAVADAVAEVKDIAKIITKKKGGRGAVREVIELILKAQGKWQAIMQRYEDQMP